MEALQIKAQKVQSLLLVMTNWQLNMSITQGNIIIANALNYCVYNKGLNIKGYLITKRRLFLIAYSEELPFDELLDIFYNQVCKGIEESKEDTILEDHSEIDMTNKCSPFKCYPLYNPYIKSIIQGEHIKLPYYNPQQNYLETKLQDYTYSSIKDYEGGKSPVVVNTKS